MKVKELIEKLNKFPADMEVKIQQLIPVRIVLVEERNVNVYEDGQIVDKKKAIVIS